MKGMNRFLRSVTLSLVIAPLFLVAGEEDDSHVPVGSRQSQTQEESAKPSEEEFTCGYIFDRYPPVYYPPSIHWFIAVSALGDSVELEDGSVWKISTYDSYKALNWHANDPLFITQNFSWFSNYTYRIVNKNTGASIEANLSLGPLKDGKYSHYILEINPVTGELILDNTSRWQVSSSDASTFRDWAPNDYVIIGQNGGWSSTFESLLINVNMNNYVHAKEY